MNVYVVVVVFLALLGFLALKPWLKVLVAFIVMSNCFDLAPQIVYGKLVWDYGALLLLIAAGQLMFQRKTAVVGKRTAVLYLLAAFTIWLVFSLVYSLVIYGYPVGDTLKTSRYWIIGYLSIFIFLRLYMVDGEALNKIVRWLYVIPYVLLIVAVIQLVTGYQWLFGLFQPYAGTIRYLPIFLPVVLLLTWVIMARFLAGEKVKIHAFVYGGLALVVTALTYTRGIYIAVILTFLLMVTLLALGKRIKASKTSVFGFVAVILVVGLVSGGLADRVIGRVASGLDILFSDKAASSKVDVDTFTGRLKLVQERFSMVSKHNPVVGYGFLHENNIPHSMLNKMEYGSIDYSPEMVEKYKYGTPYKLTLYSADIAWGNLVLVSGFVGFFIFLAFIVVFVLSFRGWRYSSSPDYYLRLAFYLQTITLLLLMFNGNTFTYHIQFPAFMLAGYVYLSMVKSDTAETAKVLQSRKESYPCLRKSRS
ncbi:MAG TPA: hypothetical protein ENI64_04395 [Gammaproteobacteria bacterium]|nr:hypothetical protein [Gammaproteobacteria bacterium]